MCDSLSSLVKSACSSVRDSFSSLTNQVTAPASPGRLKASYQAQNSFLCPHDTVTLSKDVNILPADPGAAAEHKSDAPAELLNSEDLHFSLTPKARRQLLGKEPQNNSRLLSLSAADAQGVKTLRGNRQLIQAYVSAQSTIDMLERYSGEDQRFGSGDGRLNILIGEENIWDSRVAYYSNSENLVRLGSLQLASEPDIISHEVGHAVFDNKFTQPDPQKDLAGNELFFSASEAFADTSAMLNSLQSPAVRNELLGDIGRAETSTWVSQIAENSSLTGRQEPIRDLARAGRQSPEITGEEEHESSKRFTCSMYAALLLIAQKKEQDDPGLSPQDALAQAVDTLGQDFAGLLKYHPHADSAASKDSQVSQESLAKAVLASAIANEHGDCVSIYKSCFAANGLMQLQEQEPESMYSNSFLSDLELAGSIISDMPTEASEDENQPKLVLDGGGQFHYQPVRPPQDFSHLLLEETQQCESPEISVTSEARDSEDSAPAPSKPLGSAQPLLNYMAERFKEIQRRTDMVSASLQERHPEAYRQWSESRQNKTSQ